jgi:uncharacterized protein (DUF1501 family)
MRKLTRRSILRAGILTTIARTTTPFWQPSRLLASTLPSDGYKALVCIALDGGCDGNNLIVPMSSNLYSQYQRARGNLALNLSSLIPCDDGSDAPFGFHGSMPQLAQLYGSGNAALLMNVGSLTRPVTKDVAISDPTSVPTDLMNHELQRYQWGTSYTVTGATHTYTGWGGRIADSVGSYNSGGYPTVVSLAPPSNEQVFCYGQNSYPAVVNAGVQTQLPSIGQTALNLIASTQNDAVMVGAAAKGLKDAVDQSRILQTALGASVLSLPNFPTTGIGTQLNQVLQMINARGALGMQRQIFLCVLTGFDTHQNQTINQASALSQLDAALGAFYDALANLGLQNQVTAFTTSDFGRTLTCNSNGGSDHAWGNHQIVVGGAVKGKAFYGAFPDLTLDGPDDLTGQGRWIPSTSVDQYGATVGSWFGVPNAMLTSIFPNLSNFSKRNIGFL